MIETMDNKHLSDINLSNGTEPQVDLSKYKNPPNLDKGRSIFFIALWYLMNALFLQNPINPFSRVKIFILKLFGCKIGRNVLLKPSLNVKSPWFLEIGDNVFIGEKVWIDCLAPVRIGNNVCISQDVYICCGNHDWKDPAFGKSVYPIIIEDGSWIATRSTLLPGSYVASHVVISAGTVLAKSTEPYTIYSGNPAKPIKKRIITSG